jgi:Sec-independent protein secretion pathway component TatC
MSLPMVVLYESCIWIAWFMKRRQTRAAGPVPPVE